MSASSSANSNRTTASRYGRRSPGGWQSLGKGSPARRVPWRPRSYRPAPMDKLFGLPAHPFLVHIPIVLLPLAAIGTVAIVARRTWYHSYRWIVLTIAAVGTLGAVLAASAGEELEGRI